MKSLILGACLLVLAVSNAYASEYVTKGDYPACATKASLNEAITALGNKDSAHFGSLSDCAIIRAGLRAVMIDPGVLKSKVRIFTPNDKSLVLWTRNLNIQKR